MSDDQLPNVSADEKQMAMIAHIGSVFGFLIPAAIFFLKGESPYVKYHAMQAIIMSLISGVAAVFFVGLTFGLCFPIMFVFWGFQVWKGIQANKGTWEGYPAITGVGRPPEAL